MFNLSGLSAQYRVRSQTKAKSFPRTIAWSSNLNIWQNKSGYNKSMWCPCFLDQGSLFMFLFLSTFVWHAWSIWVLYRTLDTHWYGCCLCIKDPFSIAQFRSRWNIKLHSQNPVFVSVCTLSLSGFFQDYTSVVTDPT